MHPLRRRVAQPVDAFNPGAITEMKASDRVERALIFLSACVQIAGTGRKHRLSEEISDALIIPPARCAKHRLRASFDTMQPGGFIESCDQRGVVVTAVGFAKRGDQPATKAGKR